MSGFTYQQTVLMQLFWLDTRANADSDFAQALYHELNLVERIAYDEMGAFHALHSSSLPDSATSGMMFDQLLDPDLVVGVATTVAGQFGKSGEHGIEYVDPSLLRWTQRTAGGRGRAQKYRASMSEHGWGSMPPIDVVRTEDGLVTVDHTRAVIALELDLGPIPARVHMPSDPLPDDMIGRFGSAKTWGDAAAFRAASQRPPLPPTGTTTVPRLP